MTVLAIEVGVTEVTAVVVTQEGEVAARGHQPLRRDHPQPDWTEVVPEDIWRATLGAVRAALDAHTGEPPRAVGLASPPDGVLVWDQETLGSPRAGIAGDDGRTAEICRRLRAAGHEARVAELTGAPLTPGAPATKLAWLAEHEPHTWALVESGRYAVGGIDSYLIARMTRGTWHVTDPTHAGGTLLLELASGDWSDELCSLFGVPREALPEIVPSSGIVGTTEPRMFLGLELPIAGLAATQQAAILSERCGATTQAAALGAAYLAGLAVGIWESTDTTAW